MYPVAKRLFDIVGSTLGLLVLAPLLLATAVLVKLDSDGPVLYAASRVGQRGRMFRMYKFRTMLANADKLGASSTPDDDPRITRVGRVLRKYKLDELPQLLNVANGTMSLVGPRPQMKWAVDLYSDQERQVLSVRPGMTDYASLRFPNEGEILKGSTDADKDYMEKIHPEKMRLSLEYLQQRSFATDLLVICQTVAAVFRA